MYDTAAIVARLDDLFEVVAGCSRSVQFDSGVQQHLIAVSLHGSILELARGSLQLLSIADATCFPVVLRTALEAYVDLKNLVDDPDYADNMKASWHRERSRVLENAARRGTANPYLEDLAHNPDLADGLQEARAAMQRLKDRGRPPLKVWERFQKANEEDRYESVYAHLCQHSHNNLNALAGRHLVQDAEGAAQVAFFQPIDDNDLQMYADTLAGIVANSYGFLTQIVGSGREHIPRIGVALTALRALYPDAGDIPLLVDDLKRLDPADFEMTRCMFLAVDVAGGVDDWSADLRTRELPFLVFGPAIVLHRPDPRRARFTDLDQVTALIEAVESIDGLLVETGHVWLPNFLLQSCLGEDCVQDPAACRGEVIRVRVPLFQEALRFQQGAIGAEHFASGCRDLLESARRDEPLLEQSEEESAVFRDWTRLQIDEARENYDRQKEDGRGVLQWRGPDGEVHAG